MQTAHYAKRRIPPQFRRDKAKQQIHYKRPQP
jgi:hypothetical protein